MPSPKDITDALVIPPPSSRRTSKAPRTSPPLPPMRKLRFDGFSWLVYWLLAFALVGQFFLLFSLDLFQ